jgi:ribosome-interacting GTPase 1
METVDRLARQETDGRVVMISCEKDLGLDWLLDAIWKVSGSCARWKSAGADSYRILLL